MTVAALVASCNVKSSARIALVALCCAPTAVRANDVTGPMPAVCLIADDNRALIRKLAKIAFEEAERKGVSLRGYRQVFAVRYYSRSDRSRQIWAVRFSPWRCKQLAVDGGGFDVEIDPKTFEVIDSYISFR